MNHRFLTIQECADEARTSRSTIHDWLRRGLKSIRPGRKRLIPRDAFERFLKGDAAGESAGDAGE